MNQEIWKKINYVDVKNCYEISSYGRFKNIDTNKFLKLNFKNGYKTTHIGLTTGKYKSKFVHRLVAETFMENNDNKKYVNHKDGNKTNNNINNLEWVTQSENMIHYHTELKTIQS